MIDSPNDTLTLEDLIDKVHHLVEYDTKTKIIKESENNYTHILSIEDQVNVKFFKGISNFKYIQYYDDKEKIKSSYIKEQIEYYSFLFCIFNDLSERFKNSKNKPNIINTYIQDLIRKIKSNQVIKETTSFIMNKTIYHNIKDSILTNDIIQFISIFFNINIFIIDNERNCIIFYTLNKNFNRFKHSIILVKSEYVDILKNEKFTYYKNVYYNKDINESVNGLTDGNSSKNIEPLLNELFINYPKMIIYSQIITSDLNPDVENNSYLIVKKEDDNDLNIIECCMNKNQIQIENKQTLKKERKARKTKAEPEPEKNSDPTSTVSIMNDLMIMNNEGDSSVYTQDMLNTKNHNELRQIAKQYKIKLSYVLENGDRKNKTRKELIQEILEKNK